MQSHLLIGRIILAVYICNFTFVECSCGWPGVDGYCLNQTKLKYAHQLSEVINSHDCSNLTKNENYHPCSFASSQSCAVIFIDGGWVSGCVSDDHGFFIQYLMNSSKQLVQPLKATYSQAISVGSFCKDREDECGIASIRNRAFIRPEIGVCCCKKSNCTRKHLEKWKEGKLVLTNNTKGRMISTGIVGALGVVQAVLLSTFLIALFHDYYSRYRVRVVIGEAEKTK